MSIVLATSLVHIGLVVLELGVALAIPIVCAMKGKWGCLVVGLVVPFVWLVASIRVAKPGSYWARRWYDGSKMALARERFAPSRRRVSQS